MPWGEKSAPATPSPTPRSWWRGLIRVGWGGLGSWQKQPVATPPTAAAAAAATTKARNGKIGAWLVSRWKKTAPFRANMRWGSLSYIATTWEEEERQLAASSDCGAVRGRAKVDSSSCDINDATAMDGADSAAASAFLRKRAAQGLIFGAMVAVAIYAVYRSRRKPSGPRPRRSRDDDAKSRGSAAAGARWWQPSGAYGRWIKGSSEGAGGEKKGEADDGKRTERTRASAGGGGGGGGGGDGDVGGEEHCGDEAGGRAGGEGCEGACPSLSSESLGVARTSSPSPGHDRERADGVEGEDDRPGDQGASAAAAGEGGEEDRRRSGQDVSDAGEGDGDNRLGDQDGPATGEGGDDGKSDRDVSDAGEGGDQHGVLSVWSDGGDLKEGDLHVPPVGGTPNRIRTDSYCQFFDPDSARSRGQSFWSENSTFSSEMSSTFSSEESTELLLAKADSLIADSEKASARPPGRSTSTTRPPTTTTTATTATTTRTSSDAPSRPKLFAIGKKTASSSRSSEDPRRRKRARAYRAVTGEEVDALVSLTHRALQLDPAALTEIAEDASRKQSGEDDLSAGERAGGDSSDAVGDEEGAAAKSAAS